MQFHARLNLNYLFKIRRFSFNIQFYILKQSQPSILDRTTHINLVLCQIYEAWTLLKYRHDTDTYNFT
jgi:hypothetical protein